jgi:sugar-specific transcriptional regulator TrmB
MMWACQIQELTPEQYAALSDEQIISAYQRETMLELAKVVEAVGKAQQLTSLNCPSRALEALREVDQQISTVRGHLGILDSTRRAVRDAMDAAEARKKSDARIEGFFAPETARAAPKAPKLTATTPSQDATNARQGVRRPAPFVKPLAFAVAIGVAFALGHLLPA